MRKTSVLVVYQFLLFKALLRDDRGSENHFSKDVLLIETVAAVNYSFFLSRPTVPTRESGFLDTGKVFKTRCITDCVARKRML